MADQDGRHSEMITEGNSDEEEEMGKKIIENQASQKSRLIRDAFIALIYFILFYFILFSFLLFYVFCIASLHFRATASKFLRHFDFAIFSKSAKLKCRKNFI